MKMSKIRKSDVRVRLRPSRASYFHIFALLTKQIKIAPRQQSENVKLRRPGWPETYFHEEIHNISNSMIFSIFSRIFNNFHYFSMF